MNYSDGVKWDELQVFVRERMNAQPRSYRAKLATRLNRSPGFISHLTTGRKPIPAELLDEILASLGLSYDVIVSPQEKGNAAE